MRPCGTWNGRTPRWRPRCSSFSDRTPTKCSPPPSAPGWERVKQAQPVDAEPALPRSRCKRIWQRKESIPINWLLLVALVFAINASAVDIAGTWKGSAETPDGAIERTFVVKVAGNRVTGETSSQRMGKSQITDGRIDGDTVKFSITVKFQDNEMK